ncbi:reverse transcriptase domain-containing protein [Tanacetum coccineum]
MIGSTLTEEGCNKLCNLLQRNLDIFTWKPVDMTGILRHIVEHCLNVQEGCSPVRQKKRGQAADRNQAIQFLARSAKKSLPFFKTLKKCTKKSDFHWTVEAEEAFRQMKQLIAELPMLTVPMEKEELIIYLAAAKETVLSRPKVVGRLQKWSIELGEYAIHYIPRVSVKGQILADFIVERPEDDSLDTPMEVEEKLLKPWILFMDGSSCTYGSGAGLIPTNPEGMEFTYALRFRFDATNNEAEYEALIARLRIAGQMGVGDDAVHKELGDRMERAATTASSFEAEQDSGSGPRCQATSSTNVNGEVELTANIDGQAKTITEASLRRHLKLEDNGGITSLPNTEIFEQLALMGYATDSDKLTFQKVTRGYSSDDIPLFSSMITAPDTSPSRITSSPSLSPQHTPVSAPSTSPPPITETSPTEEPAPIPHESPLQSVHSLGCDEGSVSLNELMDLVTQLTNKVGGLENELKNTKKVYGTAITKLAKRVKKLEMQVKTSKASRRTKIVLSEDDDVDEDSSKQGKSLIEELDMDADISLVPPHAEIQEKISDETKVLLEEEEATEIVQDQGSGEKGEQEVSTAAGSLVYIRRSEKKKKDKGKAILIEDESIQKKSMKQEQEKKLGHEEAIRLKEQINEEERKRIARDAEIAKQLQEEYDKAGKKEVVTKVDTAHVIDWNDPSVIRYHALQNRPRSVAEVRKNMMVYLKNQGGYNMKDFKGMSYDDIRPIFEKVKMLKQKPAKRQRIKEVSESVQEQTDEEPKTDELS